MVEVEWCPRAQDFGVPPKESMVPYEEAKKEVPRLVVDYYERHLIMY